MLFPCCFRVVAWIQALQMSGVRYLIAPYEADAQLAYLSLKGLVDIVITEDSDTLPYGCRKVCFPCLMPCPTDYNNKGWLGAFPWRVSRVMP